jgi:glutathione S-transferase
MSIVLYYTPGTCALACTVALEWLGQPYILCRVEREERASEAGP